MTTTLGGFAPATPPKTKTFLMKEKQRNSRPPAGRARDPVLQTGGHCTPVRSAEPADESRHSDRERQP
jgi:hypothetical protein